MAAVVQFPSPDSKSSVSPVPIPTVKVNGWVPLVVPSVQASVNGTACGRVG